MERIAVVDYGMGNLRSVEKALAHASPGGQEIAVTGDPEVVGNADRVVFPGQGAMRDCMEGLDRQGLRPAVVEAIRSRPFLGICIGLQALMEHSEEDGGTPGLGVLEGSVRRFAVARDPATGERLKVPHMGWNNVAQAAPHPLWEGIEDGARFYFANSYHVVPGDDTVVAARTEYGGIFASGVARGRLFAVQFHPEKSQHPGLRLLANFLA